MSYTWTNNGRVTVETVTPLEHWFHAFGEARNAIIHGDNRQGLTYDEVSSPYRGNLIMVAQRVLIEALLVNFAELGFSALWQSKLTRAILRRMAGDCFVLGTGADQAEP